MARPVGSIKLNDHICKRLLHAFSNGFPLGLSAKYAGISDETLRSWLSTGEGAKKGHPLRTLHDDLRNAEGECCDRWLAKVDQYGKRKLEAILWRLEKKWPKQFGKRERKEITGEDGGPVEIVFPDLNNEESRAHYRALCSKAGTGHSQIRPDGNGNLRE